MDWSLEFVFTLVITVMINGMVWIGVLFNLVVVYEGVLPSKTAQTALLSIGIVFFFGSWVATAYWVSVEACLLQCLFILFIVVASLYVLYWIAYIVWKIIEKSKRRTENAARAKDNTNVL